MKLNAHGKPYKFQVCAHCGTEDKKPKAKVCAQLSCVKKEASLVSKRKWQARRKLKRPVCVYCQSTDKKPEAKVCYSQECKARLMADKQRRYATRRWQRATCTDCHRRLSFLDHGSQRDFFCKPCKREKRRLEQALRDFNNRRKTT